MNKQDLVDYWMSNRMINSNKLIEAFKEIPREYFVLEAMLEQAYLDAPLEIICKQTISQPTTVMLMLDALNLQKTDKVLEIGAGSGYNAAIMSRLSDKVYSIEILPELVEFARKNLAKIGIKNVEVIEGDGSLGYEAQSPYDKIIVTAACPGVPEALFKQSKPNSIIIAPVTYIQPMHQRMFKFVQDSYNTTFCDLGEFRFVPLTGKFGHK